MFLVPAATAGGPGQRGVDGVGVAHKLVRDVLARRDAVDVLAGDLGQPARNVLGRPRHGRQQRAVAHRRVRPREDEVVRHVWARDGQVGFGFVAPLVRQRHPAAAHHRVVGDVRDVEARGAHEDVDGFVGGSIGGGDDA